MDIKARYESQIAKLEREKNSQIPVGDSLLEYVHGASDILRNLPRFYQEAVLPVKQKLIGSICVQKLIFENKDYRTMEFNYIIQGICRLGVYCDEQKIEQASNFGSLSEEVTRIGLPAAIRTPARGLPKGPQRLAALRFLHSYALANKFASLQKCKNPDFRRGLRDPDWISWTDPNTPLKALPKASYPAGAGWGYSFAPLS